MRDRLIRLKKYHKSANDRKWVAAWCTVVDGSKRFCVVRYGATAKVALVKLIAALPLTDGPIEREAIDQLKGMLRQKCPGLRGALLFAKKSPFDYDEAMAIVYDEWSARQRIRNREGA